MKIFTYGTLMDPEIMAKVCGACPESVKATLRGYARYGVRGEQYPGMVPEESGRVAGILYCDLSSPAVERLDLFEGSMYDRLEVEVALESSQESCAAMAYVVKPEYSHLLTEAGWDFAEFIKNGGKQLFQQRYGGFDEINGV